MTCCIVAVLLIAPAAAEQRLFVRADASVGGDGASWATALQHLQDALALASDDPNIAEIWVAGGVYRPDRGADVTPGAPNQAFQLRSGLRLVGGLSGVEDPNAFDLRRRNFAANASILCGDLLDDDAPAFTNRSDNARHVLMINNADNSAELNGFVIRGGGATGVDDASFGGGAFIIDSSPRIIDCTFCENLAISGGGAFVCDSTPHFDRCRFTLNQANDKGGAIFNYGVCTPRLTNCLFTANAASYAGAVGNMSASPDLLNCTFHANRATLAGGAIRTCCGGAPVLANCILWNNEPEQIDGVAAVSYSVVSGGFAGDGNLDVEPRFVALGSWVGDAWTPGCYQLLADSPCIDAGASDPNSEMLLPSADLDRHLRVWDGDLDGVSRVDIGASEYRLLGDLNCDGSFDTYDIDPFTVALADPASYAATYPDCHIMLGDLNDDGRVDTYDIDAFVAGIIGS